MTTPCPAYIVVAVRPTGLAALAGEQKLTLHCKVTRKHKSHEPAVPAGVTIWGREGDRWVLKV